MASKIAAPRYRIRHSRFIKEDGWQLDDLCYSLNGNIAVTGHNEKTYRTYIDVYTFVRHPHSGNKVDTVYSKEFEKYSDEKWIYHGRYVSFIDDDVLVCCLGNKLEVFQVNKDEVLQSRRVNGSARCLSVKERKEIFIGFQTSNKITVYDVIDLKEIKSIILQGIPDGYWPYDLTAIADRIFVCVGEGNEGSEKKSLVFEEENGRILSELTKPSDNVKWYINSVGVNTNTLGIAGVVWWDSFYKREGGRWQIIFYSLLRESNCSFLTVEVESDVDRIRMSDRGDRMITGNNLTGRVKVYDMAEVFTYSHLKEKLASTLQIDECAKLANFFEISKDQADAILSSEKSSESLLLVLEEKGILKPYNVDRLIEAFHEMTINPFCGHVAEIFLNTRSLTFYRKAIEKLQEEINDSRMTTDEERRRLKEKTSEVDGLQKKVKTLQEAYLKMAQVINKFKSERNAYQQHVSYLEKELTISQKSSSAIRETVFKQCKGFLQKALQNNNMLKETLAQRKEQFSSLEKDLQVSKEAQDETARVLQQTKELNQQILLERSKLKAELDESQLQLSGLQAELKATKNANRMQKTDFEKALKEKEVLLQKTIQEKNKIKAELVQLQIDHPFGCTSLPERRKRQAESSKTASKNVADASSLDKGRFLPESVLEDEFSKVIVKVSKRLKRTDCAYLARYFNFSPPKVAAILEESKTPGLDLLHAMKEQSIIKLHDVTELQEALLVLDLQEINETLVKPYQRNIDPKSYKRLKML